MTAISSEISGLHPLLKRLSRRFTHDDDESSDLVQDTILKALSYSDKFKQNTNLQGWLFTIMRNTFINHYRKKRRLVALQASTREPFLSNIEDRHTFSSPERKYAWEELWRSIDALREELKIPFRLHVSGYKYHEIAESLNIPIGTVKNRIFQARKKIQGRLL